MSDERITIRCFGSLQIKEQTVLQSITNDKDLECDVAPGEEVTLDTEPKVRIVCLEQ